MRLSELEYCAPLAYSPYGTDPASRASRVLRDELKGDRLRGSPPRTFAARFANYLADGPLSATFAAAFGRDVGLVPVPRSSLRRPGDFWMPLRIAEALAAAGLAGEVMPLLRRTTALPKASSSAPERRPIPLQHEQSLSIDARLVRSSRLLLVDDVITRGATLLGAGSRLAEGYPNLPIRAFAVLRTISGPAAFRDSVDPVFGRVVLRPQGDTLRRP